MDMLAGLSGLAGDLFSAPVTVVANRRPLPRAQRESWCVYEMVDNGHALDKRTFLWESVFNAPKNNSDRIGVRDHDSKWLSFSGSGSCWRASGRRDCCKPDARAGTHDRTARRAQNRFFVPLPVGWISRREGGSSRGTSGDSHFAGDRHFRSPPRRWLTMRRRRLSSTAKALGEAVLSPREDESYALDITGERGCSLRIRRSASCAARRHSCSPSSPSSPVHPALLSRRYASTTIPVLPGEDS